MQRYLYYSKISICRTNRLKESKIFFEVFSSWLFQSINNFQEISFHIQVQTEDQYIFIHDAILEAINCGNTELPARNLYNHLHSLTTPDDQSNITGMELEFKVRNKYL